jgi:hypothetical protein
LKYLARVADESNEFARTKFLFATATSVAGIDANRTRSLLFPPYQTVAYGTSFLTRQARLVDTTPVLQHRKKRQQLLEHKTFSKEAEHNFNANREGIHG